MRKFALWLVAAVVAIAGIVAASGAKADEEKLAVGPSIVGVHAPCPVTHPWPGKDASLSEIQKQIETNFSVKLAGSGWSDANRKQIQILWESLDAVSCTEFMATIQQRNSGNIGINAAPISGYAWGDWGLTKSGYVTMDFGKWSEVLGNNDPGRLSRLIIHEFTHAWNADRFGNPAYWTQFQSLAKKQGQFTSYAGTKDTETLAEVVGYYVARCAADNPYDTGKFNDYYAWVKKNVFAGREFGPAPGTKAKCDVTADDIAASASASPSPSIPAWVRALSGD